MNEKPQNSEQGGSFVGCPVPLRPPLAPAKAKIHRRKREAVPEAIRQEVIEFGKRLQENHASVFAANPRLKRCVARILESVLPPPSRRPGRPGSPEVTVAQRLLNEIRQMHPRESYRRIWQFVYPAVIPDHASLNKLERRAAEQELRDRVRWRRCVRKRAARLAKTPTRT